jgi:hypothetical protein
MLISKASKLPNWKSLSTLGDKLKLTDTKPPEIKSDVTVVPAPMITTISLPPRSPALGFLNFHTPSRDLP